MSWRITSNPERCRETRETIANMCRYIADDGKIARHVAVREAFVARVRSGLDATDDARRMHKKRGVSGRSASSDTGYDEHVHFRIATRAASERLAAAIGRMG